MEEGKTNVEKPELSLVEQSRKILRQIPKPKDVVEYQDMARTAIIEDPEIKFQLELKKWVQEKTRQGWTMRRIKRELKRKGL
jgi:hypothetical protein